MTIDLVPDLFFRYLANILVSPISPLMRLTKELLLIDIDFKPFLGIWAVVIYLLSIFSVILIAISGFNFIHYSDSPERRLKAKNGLRNVIFMVVLIQISYFLYQAIVDFSSALSLASISLINDDFFVLNYTNLGNLASSILLSFLCVISIIITNIMLMIRYIFVAIGVFIFPTGVLLYFSPGLKIYGKIIFNFLGMFIFINFIISFLILSFSKLVSYTVFNENKLMLLAGLFILINFIFILVPLFGSIGLKNEL